MPVAFVAASMLLLQALIGAFALGAAAASPMADAFGNPLCITSMDEAGSGADRDDHAMLPDCCMALCGMFAPAAPEDRAAHSLLNPLMAASTRLAAASGAVVPSLPLERGPGNPRAPPRAA